ncbi:STAS domain-containing protein [Streptomyces sp. HUAS TT20]|uniref:STAS domain-containing protein n=1 Tax=Streptomyces sp. HUAS TT20 TaxID=3447509 RepID=UPI0021DB40E2|nr:STAS domain-containing protein [Streptomyces sp. HUAS 15-9]UXY32354.1 STAS domain-containing protein [Streptomyces sp. HUAS 15-9]
MTYAMTRRMPMTAALASPAMEDGAVKLSGELDLDSVPRIEPELTRLATASAPELVLDLTDVTFCDSSGVTMFLRLHGRCTAANTRLRLRSVPPRPGRVFRLLSLDQFIPCAFQ